MRKQFAESHTSHRLHDDKPFPSIRLSDSKMALKHDGEHLETQRPPSARPEAQTTAGPLLKHATLTPAQRQYLCTIAASYSPAHVRKLISQHYVNILHRSIRTGINADRDDLVVTSLEEEHPAKSQSQVSSQGKQRGKTKSNGKHSHKTSLPKLPDMPASNFASKPRKVKKHTTPKKKPTLKRVRRAMEEQEVGGLNNSLSECLSSLSVGGWETDSSSDVSTAVVRFSC